MDGFQVELLRRLPLAESVLRLFCYALDKSVLDDVFQTHRGRCYQGVLTFPSLVVLIRDALDSLPDVYLICLGRRESKGQEDPDETNHTDTSWLAHGYISLFCAAPVGRIFHRFAPVAAGDASVFS